MINAIKESLYGKEEKLKDILKEINCTNIHTAGNQIRFGMDNEGSGNGNSLNIETLFFKSFSRGINGDIITLVSAMLNVSIGESIKWLAKLLNISATEYKSKNVNLPFGGFWKEFKTNKNDEDVRSRTYSEDEYKKYKTGVSKLFIDDGISAKTQEEFEIGMDLISNRITIRWENELGELVGIMGRLNKTELGDKENKYLPIIPFNKSKNLYGFYRNYPYIYNHNEVIIVESEKSVLKARQHGYYNVLALGGNTISFTQAKLIKSLGLNVIIALDEGIELIHSIKQARKVQIKNIFFKNEVYVLDMEGLSHKSCIFDLDSATIKQALKDRLIFIE